MKVVYNQNLCSKALKWGRQGLTPGEMAALCGVTLKQWLKWQTEYPAFEEACAIAQQSCEGYLMDAARGRVASGSDKMITYLLDKNHTEHDDTQVVGEFAVTFKSLKKSIDD